MKVKTVKLGNLAKFLNGGTPSKEVSEYWSGTVPWISSADIAEDTIQQPRHYVTETAIQKSATNLVPTNTLLIVTRTGVGKLAITSEPLCFSQDITAILLPDDCNIRYIARSIKSQTNTLVTQARGATIKGITRDVIENLRIPLPPLPEQKRIAAILDKADELKRKRELAIAKLDLLAQSIFVEIFGNAATNDKEWMIKPLADLCEISGEYGAGVASIEYSPSLPIYVRITDITDNGELNNKTVSPAGSESDWGSYKLEKGDILFARSGATVGKTYLHQHTTGNYVFAGYLIRFRPNASVLNPDFLFHFTKTKAYKAWVQARQRVVAQPNINAKQYGYDLLIPVPPLKLQEEFANRINKLEKLKADNLVALAKQNSVFTSLQHQAFSGHL